MAGTDAEDDAYLVRVCLRLPGAAEKVSHGRPCFFTTRVFAVYGGVEKGDHHSGRFDCAVLIKPDPAEAQALMADSRFFIPAYWGPAGWIGLDFRSTDVDWKEVAELVRDSYLQTAPMRLARALRDAR